MDRTERLVNLLVALLDTERPLTREELRQRVGGYSDDEANFRRNFERDKELLRQMGIPLEVVLPGPSSPEAEAGYRVPRQAYELPDPGLTEEELTALRLAVSAVSFEQAAEGAATSALWKLAAASVSPAPGLGAPRPERAARAEPRPAQGQVPAAGGQRATQDALAVEGAVPLARGGAPLAEVPADTKVATLFAAVAQRRPVRFSYGGLERRVDPWRLSYRQGKWYLAGFDHQRGAERLFRVDRIATEVATEGQPGAFSRPAHVAAGPPPPWRLGDDEEVAVELRVDASQVPFVASLAGPAAVARTEADGSARFRLTVTNRVALRNFVLGFLEHAEVVGPPQVRDDMVSWLRRLVGAEGQP